MSHLVMIDNNAFMFILHKNNINSQRRYTVYIQWLTSAASKGGAIPNSRYVRLLKVTD
jgi:hypothetical protein